MSTEPAPKIILLVEDDEMVRTVAAETLLFAGYDVIPSVNGQEALAVSYTHLTLPTKLL
jgi:CheY-like chemotaxis protein